MKISWAHALKAAIQGMFSLRAMLVWAGLAVGLALLIKITDWHNHRAWGWFLGFWLLSLMLDVINAKAGRVVVRLVRPGGPIVNSLDGTVYEGGTPKGELLEK